MTGDDIKQWADKLDVGVKIEASKGQFSFYHKRKKTTLAVVNTIPNAILYLRGFEDGKLNSY